MWFTKNTILLFISTKKFNTKTKTNKRKSIKKLNINIIAHIIKNKASPINKNKLYR